MHRLFEAIAHPPARIGAIRKPALDARDDGDILEIDLIPKIQHRGDGFGLGLGGDFRMRHQPRGLDGFGGARAGGRESRTRDSASQKR